MSGGEDSLTAVLVGYASSPEKAEAIARDSRDCPYVAVYTAVGRVVFGVFAIPPSKRWWIEYPREHPELLGLERIVVEVTEVVDASSPWTRGTVEPVLDVAPCGTACDRCPQYETRCQGCPATAYYVRHRGDSGALLAGRMPGDSA